MVDITDMDVANVVVIVDIIVPTNDYRFFANADKETDKFTLFIKKSFSYLPNVECTQNGVMIQF